MSIYCLSQMFNEKLFAERALTWIYPLIDCIIVAEGRLTPFGGLAEHSTDGTRKIIKDFIKEKDTKNKIIFVDANPGNPKNREQAEGNCKQNRLNLAIKNGLQNGDIVFTLDADEFFIPDKFLSIVDLMKRNENILHVPVSEFQFAYNLELCFPSSHGGRFFRYRDGLKYGSTNHLYLDGKEITKDRTWLQDFDHTGMCHLSYVKHPKDIKDKVVSFRRQSFSLWYSLVYLEYPFSSENAYNNNKRIPPYHGQGWAEGMKHKLNKFQGTLPDAIQDLNVDWLEYIRNNVEFLKIPLEYQ